MNFVPLSLYKRAIANMSDVPYLFAFCDSEIGKLQISEASCVQSKRQSLYYFIATRQLHILPVVEVQFHDTAAFQP